MNNSTPEKSWRLVYTSTEVLELFLSEGITSTIHNLFTSASYEDCLALIHSLNLRFDLNNENNS